jgi:DNA invertase Pin-like site-specific DNA recombinase
MELIGYARVSTLGQENGLETQKQYCCLTFSAHLHSLREI